MKRLLLIVSAVLVVMPDIAAAQQQNGPPQRPGGSARPSPGQRPGGGDRPSRPGPQVRPQRPGGPQVQPPRPGRPQIQPPRPGQGGGNRPGNGYRPGNGNRPGGGNQRPPGYRPPPGYWQSNNWARRRIAAPRYSYPRGYGYRRWSVGLILPAIFLAATYRYADYGRLGLYAPPYGYDWVRYGPDLVLVDRGNGRIADVRYGIFG